MTTRLFASTDAKLAMPLSSVFSLRGGRDAMCRGETAGAGFGIGVNSHLRAGVRVSREV